MSQFSLWLKMQYTSLNDFNHGIEAHLWIAIRLSSSQWPVAHLAFNTPHIASATPFGNALGQKLLDHALMKGFPLHRGE